MSGNAANATSKNKVNAIKRQRRWHSAGAAAAVIALLAGACSGDGGTAGAREGEVLTVFATVVDGNFRFLPHALAIEPGETILWAQMGGLHDVASYDAGNEVERRTPQGAASFHSGYFGVDIPGLAFAITPEQHGVYDYYCKPHAFFGMVGRIVVGEVGATPSYASTPDERFPWVEFAAIEDITGAARSAYRWEALLQTPVAVLLAEGEEKDAKRRMSDLQQRFANGDGDAADLRALLEEQGLVDTFAAQLTGLSAALDSGDGQAMLDAAAEARATLNLLRPPRPEVLIPEGIPLPEGVEVPGQEKGFFD